MPTARKARLTLRERLGKTSMLRQRSPISITDGGRRRYRRICRDSAGAFTNTPGMEAQDMGAHRQAAPGSAWGIECSYDGAQARSITGSEIAPPGFPVALALEV